MKPDEQFSSTGTEMVTVSRKLKLNQMGSYKLYSVLQTKQALLEFKDKK